MPSDPRSGHRLDRSRSPSLRNWEEPTAPVAEQMGSNVAIDMGWGRLIFGQTFASSQELVDVLCEEREGRRDIALYLRDPHVVLSLAPHELFLDPSHTFRLWSHKYRPSQHLPAVRVRRLFDGDDARAVNEIYIARGMVPCDPAFMLSESATRLRTYFVAESSEGGIVGTVTGVDHVSAFEDPEKGASLWCLAVHPTTQVPGVGEALVRQLVEHYFARSRDYVDLSVLHDNREAIRLYEKLGFERVPVFCIKRKNRINEQLFISPQPDAQLNPYARIIVDEARRRGIGVDVLDEKGGYFRLMLGGRSVTCRESLTELTSAIAFCRCDDKRLTHKTLEDAGLPVPVQKSTTDLEEAAAFLKQHERIVVKPARGEQGNGVSVDIQTEQELGEAMQVAHDACPDVILEEFVHGQDVRVIVIGGQVVAAAVRRPARITGTGRHTTKELIEKYNRRRMAATGGESRVPFDSETVRTLAAAGIGWDTVVPNGETIAVRRTANLHTGGTIEDVTPQLHSDVASVSVQAANALEIPVVGLDLCVPELTGSECTIIEANERPGLANHEPQPTAERFIDLLFPLTAASGERN